MTCIHHALFLILYEDNLDVFIEVMDTHKSKNYDNCKCVYYPKNIELHSLFHAAHIGSYNIFKYLMDQKITDERNDYKCKLLLIATSNNNVKIAELLLKLRTNPNDFQNLLSPRALSENKKTPLAMSIIRGNIKMVELLLQYGADVNSESDYSYGDTPLLLAVYYNNEEIVKLLLHHNADLNKGNTRKITPLHRAIIEYNGYYYTSQNKQCKKIIKILLDHGANSNIKNDTERTSLHEASLGQDKKIINLLLQHGANSNEQDNQGDTPLHLAMIIKNKKEKIVELLLKHNADPNKQNNRGDTPLHFATMNDDKNEKIVKLLLKHNADSNKEDDNENTPLHIATMNKSEKIVELLLQHKADPNKENIDKNTPLHLAIDNKKIVELLLQHKADPNKGDINGNTPLHLAIDDEKIVELLLKHGADPNKENEDNITPLQHAAMCNHKKIVELLFPVSDFKYQTNIEVVKYIKQEKIFVNYNEIFLILLSHHFDTESLFSQKYLPKDLMFLILKKIKNDKLLDLFKENILY